VRISSPEPTRTTEVPETLRFSMTRFFKFLAGEPRQEFVDVLRGVSHELG
jgi:hypothetical protein